MSWTPSHYTFSPCQNAKMWELCFSACVFQKLVLRQFMGDLVSKAEMRLPCSLLLFESLCITKKHRWCSMCLQDLSLLQKQLTFSLSSRKSKTLYGIVMFLCRCLDVSSVFNLSWKGWLDFATWEYKRLLFCPPRFLHHSPYLLYQKERSVASWCALFSGKQNVPCIWAWRSLGCTKDDDGVRHVCVELPFAPIQNFA